MPAVSTHLINIARCSCANGLCQLEGITDGCRRRRWMLKDSVQDDVSTCEQNYRRISTRSLHGEDQRCVGRSSPSLVWNSQHTTFDIAANCSISCWEQKIVERFHRFLSLTKSAISRQPLNNGFAVCILTHCSPMPDIIKVCSPIFDRRLSKKH